MKNSSYKEMSKVLLDSHSVLIFPHVNGDGDALGSSMAMAMALRSIGKEAYVLISEEIPDNLKFLDRGCFTEDKKVFKEHDLSICLDCGEITRLDDRADVFLKGAVTACIDHHGTSKGFCDYNIIEEKTAATAQLVYKLIKSMGITLSKDIGEGIFTGILTDTGSFRYSNTQKESHEIVAALYDLGIESSKISIEIYENMPLSKVDLMNKAMNEMEIFSEGRAAITMVTQDMLKKTQSQMNESEGITEEMRKIKGVEVAALLKEYSPDEIKVSFRSKNYFNVAEIGSKYHGGGHVRAAGCTLKMTMDKALELMKDEVEECFKKYGI